MINSDLVDSAIESQTDQKVELVEEESVKPKFTSLIDDWNITYSV